MKKNNTWNIVVCPIDQATQRIIMKIVGFLIFQIQHKLGCTMEYKSKLTKLQKPLFELTIQPWEAV